MQELDINEEKKTVVIICFTATAVLSLDRPENEDLKSDDDSGFNMEPETEIRQCNECNLTEQSTPRLQWSLKLLVRSALDILCSLPFHFKLSKFLLQIVRVSVQ